jgi:hypothetical protein
MKTQRTTTWIQRLTIGAIVAASASLGAVAGPAQSAQGEITYTLYRESAPTSDQIDAYNRIDAAVSAAVAQYNATTDITKHLNVYYRPGVPTAEASYDGTISFGSDRAYMVEGTALHEISHTLGIGQSGGWFDRCVDGGWTGAGANALVRSWDGPDARVNCGGSHIWPYGLNYSNEFSELAFERHVELIEAMIADGM